MTRYHATEEGSIPFTPEEEAEWDAMEAAWELEQQERKKTEYQRLRRGEYPPMEDYLDGIVKGDQAQIDKYISDCLAVKAKYPKPETTWKTGT